MTSAVSVLLKIPQGIPTKVIFTGANESASLTIAAFGQQATTKMDAKIVGSAVVVPSNYTTASNFSKTAHPGGVVDVVGGAYAEDTINSVVYRFHVTSNRIIRVRNSLDLFEAAATSGIEGHLREADVNRSLVLGSYCSNTITTYAFQPNATSTLSGLTPANTGWGGVAYYGCGAYSGGTNGLNITCDSSGNMTYSLTFNGNKYNSSSSMTPRALFGNSIQDCKIIGYGNYIFCFLVNYTSNGYYRTVGACSAPISGFTDNPDTNPGWANTVYYYFPNEYMVGSGTLSGIPGTICEIGGVVFVLIRRFSGDNANDSWLMRAVLNGTNGSVSNITAVSTSVRFDASFTPIKVGTKLIYKTIGGGLIYVKLDGTMESIVALPTSLNMKTLSTNYAASYMYKNVDVASDTDGLAYVASSNAYTTNGTYFCTKDGKYTLTTDNSLNQLILFDTDNTWFEKQVQLNISDRIDYTQVTLAPSQALWVTANNDIQINVFGFKG